MSHILMMMVEDLPFELICLALSFLGSSDIDSFTRSTRRKGTATTATTSVVVKDILESCYLRDGDDTPPLLPGETWLELLSFFERQRSKQRKFGSYAAAGGAHSLVVTSSGRMYGCGRNGHGRLGFSSACPCCAASVFLPKALPMSSSSNYQVSSVTTGCAHSIIVTRCGKVFTCGSGGYGQLGHGDMQDQGSPREVEALKGVKVVAASAFNCTSSVVTAEGEVWTFGNGMPGHLGHGSFENVTSPKKVEALADVKIVSVAVGGGHQVFIGSDGYARMCGKAFSGQLGLGFLQKRIVLVPTIVQLSGQDEGGSVPASSSLSPPAAVAPLDTQVVHAAAGRTHTILVTASGGVFTCGKGDEGQLGHGDREPRFTPCRVQALAGKRVLGVAAAGNHSVAFTHDDVLYTFGSNDEGEQLGFSACSHHHHDQFSAQMSYDHDDASSSNHWHPGTISALPNPFEGGRRIRHVAAADAHCVVVMEDGDEVFAFGWGQHGQLGVGRDVVQLDAPKRMLLGVHGCDRNNRSSTVGKEQDTLEEDSVCPGEQQQEQLQRSVG